MVAALIPMSPITTTSVATRKARKKTPRFSGPSPRATRTLSTMAEIAVTDIVTAISAIVLSVLVARGLGPENRGVFFLAFLVATLVVVIGDMGMSAATISYAANRE